MDHVSSESPTITKLRKQAEAFMDQNPDTLKEMPSEDIHRLVHELQVHQIELEMQNEELRRAQVELEDSRRSYVDLYDFAPVGYFTLSPKRLIVKVNLTGAGLLSTTRQHLLKSRFSQFVATDSQDVFFKHCRQVLDSESVQSVELQLMRQDGSQLWGQLDSFAARDDQGDSSQIRTSITDISIRKQAEQKLCIYQGQLRSMAIELSLAEERVRRQVAYDLHESLMQDLCFIKMNLDRLSAEREVTDLVSQLEPLRAIMRKAMQHCRSLTFQLSPSTLYEMGLEAALGEMTREIQKLHKLECTVVGAIDKSLLAEDTAVILYRSVCELVHNVVKHAKASAVKIQLSRNPKDLFIAVQDNGTGFDVTKADSRAVKGGGIGLFSIRERLSHFGGHLDIESTPGQGTRMTIKLPLNR